MALLNNIVKSASKKAFAEFEGVMQWVQKYKPPAGMKPPADYKEAKNLFIDNAKEILTQNTNPWFKPKTGDFSKGMRIINMQDEVDVLRRKVMTGKGKLSSEEARNVHELFNLSKGGKAMAASSVPVLGDSNEPSVSPLDVAKEVPGAAVDTAKKVGSFGKELVQEVAKTPLRVGASLVDAGRVLTGNEPMEPFDVPGLGEVKSAQRSVIDRQEEGESQTGAILGAGGEAILDILVTAGVSKSVFNNLKKSFGKKVATETVKQTAPQTNRQLADQLRREQVIEQARRGIQQSVKGVDTTDIKNVKSIAGLAENQFQKNAVAQLKKNGSTDIANKLARMDFAQVDNMDDVIAQLVGEFGKEKVFTNPDLMNHLKFMRGLLTELDPSKIGSILLP